MLPAPDFCLPQRRPPCSRHCATSAHTGCGNPHPTRFPDRSMAAMMFRSVNYCHLLPDVIGYKRHTTVYLIPVRECSFCFRQKRILHLCILLRGYEGCVAAIGVMRFSAAQLRLRRFFYLLVSNMRKSLWSMERN